jgi:hypothetical protein
MSSFIQFNDLGVENRLETDGETNMWRFFFKSATNTKYNRAAFGRCVLSRVATQNLTEISSILPNRISETGYGSHESSSQSSYATSTHRWTFSARRRVGMCRHCPRPRATNVRHSDRVRETMRLMSVFLFRIKRRLCPNTRDHERPDYTSRAAQSHVSEQSEQFSGVVGLAIIHHFLFCLGFRTLWRW